LRLTPRRGDDRPVIADLDTTLEALLKRELPAAIVAATAISFEAPDDHFATSGVAFPAIDLFLYDIRENTALRANEWIVERPAQGDLVRHPPLTRVDCSYLVTAWSSTSGPGRAQDEHKLLAEVLKVLVRFPVVPEELLVGELSGADPPLPMTSLTPGPLSSPAELWQALGGKPRAALNLTVTVAVVPTAEDAGPPVQERIFELSQGVPPPAG
jgi:Pvc16 N-terminal domain